MHAPLPGSIAQGAYDLCRWLSLGIHVVAANKRLGAGPLPDYQAVKTAQRKYCTHFLAEVGPHAKRESIALYTALCEPLQTGAVNNQQ